MAERRDLLEEIIALGLSGARQQSSSPVDDMIVDVLRPFTNEIANAITQANIETPSPSLPPLPNQAGERASGFDLDDTFWDQLVNSGQPMTRRIYNGDYDMASQTHYTINSNVNATQPLPEPPLGSIFNEFDLDDIRALIHRGRPLEAAGMVMANISNPVMDGDNAENYDHNDFRSSIKTHVKNFLRGSSTIDDALERCNAVMDDYGVGDDDSAENMDLFISDLRTAFLEVEPIVRIFHPAPPPPKPTPKSSELKNEPDYKNNYEQNPLLFMIKTFQNDKKFNPLIQYISNTANMSRTKIDNWDLLEIFTDKETDYLVLEKREINKRFFASRMPNELIGHVVPEEVKKRKKVDLSEVAGGSMDSIKNGLEDEMRVIKEKYDKTLKRLRTLRDELTPLQVNYDCMFGSGVKNLEELLQKQLDQINENGIFEVVKYDRTNNRMIFRNVHPFIINLDKKFQTPKVKTIELGFMEIEVNINNFKTFVWPTKENARHVYFGRSGPFIDEMSGDICFGAEVMKIDEYKKNRDFINHMRLVYDVMSQYTPGVIPRRQISFFVAEQEQINDYKTSGVIEYFTEPRQRIKKEMREAMIRLNGRLRDNSHMMTVYDFKSQTFKKRNLIVQCPACEKSVINCECHNLL